MPRDIGETIRQNRDAILRIAAAQLIDISSFQSTISEMPHSPGQQLPFGMR
jgi:hypothetical protein